MCWARLPADPCSFIASPPDGTNAAARRINLSHLDDNTFPQVIMLHHFEKADRVNCTFVSQPGSLSLWNRLSHHIPDSEFAWLTPIVLSAKHLHCVVLNMGYEFLSRYFTPSPYEQQNKGVVSSLIWVFCFSVGGCMTWLMNSAHYPQYRAIIEQQGCHCVWDVSHRFK